jgi:signal transduction histidine kinase
MVFGGLNSYEMIDPSAVGEYNYAKRLLISGIETIRNEKDKRFSTYLDGEKISFETGKEALKVYLANLDFNFGYGYSFQYSLDGKNWFKTDKKNWILLSNLTHGDYTLKIRMYNPFGQLVDEKAFPLYVSAPFYVKSSFYFLIFCVILVLVILFVLYFIRSLRIKAKTQSKIAMDLHDESGTILTRLLLISKRKKFDESEIERLQIGLKEALYSFRTYLDSISRKKYALRDLNDELQEFVQSSCEQAQIQVKFDSATDKNYMLRGELFRDIKLSIYEIVTNCIKHSGADQLKLNFVAKNKTLQIHISDNGVCDLHELDVFKGNGIRNIRKRISRNRGRYSYYIAKGSQGLTIEIHLPL